MSALEQLLRKSPNELVRELEMFSAWNNPDRQEFEKAIRKAIPQIASLSDTKAEQYFGARIGAVYLNLLRKKYRRNKLLRLALMQWVIEWMQDEEKLQIITSVVEGWPEKKRREQRELDDRYDCMLID